MLLRKRQVLRKVEVTEGTAVALVAGDYVQALDIQTTTPQDIEDRITPGASLSEDLGVPGRSSFQSTYGIDLYSLGDVGGLVPAFDTEVRACGLKVGQINYLTVSVAPTGPNWAGQVVSDGLGGTAQLAAPVQNSKLIYRNAAGGFPGDTSVSTPTSGGITLASTTPAGAVWQYSPDSTATATVVLTGAGWGGTTTPPVVGEIVTNGLDGEQAARGLVVSLVSTILEIVPILPHRAFLAGETVTGLTGGGTNTVDAGGQALFRIPSLTIRDNIDGWHRTGSGVRGSAEIVMEAGKVGRMNCTMQGQLSSHGDTALVTGVTTVTPSLLPRWASAITAIDGFRIPESRWSLNFGAQVVLLADSQGTNGVRGSAITSRQPVLTIDPDRMPAAVLNTLSRQQTGTTINCYTQWGSTNGLRLAIHIPRGQLYSQEDADKEGLLASNLNVRCKRQTADGDDEFYILSGI